MAISPNVFIFKKQDQSKNSGSGLIFQIKLFIRFFSDAL